MRLLLQVGMGVGGGLALGAAAGAVDLLAGVSRIGLRADQPDRPLLVLAGTGVAGVTGGVALGAPVLSVAAGLTTLVAGYLAGVVVLGHARGY